MGDGWNIFDVLIVLISVLSLSFKSPGNIGALRLLRLLRPIRTVNRFTGLKVVVNSLISSFVSMGDVAFLMLFFTVVFAVFGIHVWNGVFHQRCNITHNYTNGEEVQSCSMIPHLGGYQCPENVQCFLDYKLRNPVEGLLGFDNFGTAMLTIFVVSTLEDWSPVYYKISDSTTPLCCFFFILIIVFCSYFSLTLVIGVMLDEIAAATLVQEEETEKEALYQKQTKELEVIFTLRKSLRQSFMSDGESTKRGRSLDPVVENNLQGMQEMTTLTKSISPILFDKSEQTLEGDQRRTLEGDQRRVSEAIIRQSTSIDDSCNSHEERPKAKKKKKN